MAVSLSVSTDNSSIPVAFRLYLPEVWAQDSRRRKKSGVPRKFRFRPNRKLRYGRFGRHAWYRRSAPCTRPGSAGCSSGVGYQSAETAVRRAG